MLKNTTLTAVGREVKIVSVVNAKQPNQFWLRHAMRSIASRRQTTICAYALCQKGKIAHSYLLSIFLGDTTLTAIGVQIHSKDSYQQVIWNEEIL